MIDVIKSPSVRTDVLKFNAPEEEGEMQALEDYAGKDQPFVFINGKAIMWKDIVDLRIKNTKFLPTISLVFEDTYEIFTSELAITNGDLISVYIRPPNEDTKAIRSDFYILSSKPSSSGGNTKFYLRGILHLPKVWKEENEAYHNKSSISVFENITNKLDLGLISNIRNTEDNMTWINHYTTIKEFIKHVTQHSYIGDESFLTSFIDLHYHLNFIEVNQELPKSDDFLEKSELEETVHTIGDKKELGLTIFHNVSDLEQSSISFSKSHLQDESGELSLSTGYKKVIQYYSEVDREELDFTIDPLVTQENENNFLMKGRKFEEYYKQIKKYRYRGIEFNRDNTHSNFKYAELLNHLNLQELEKLKLVIELDRVNLNIYRYMQVPLIFIRDFSQHKGYKFNRFLSGNYIIDGFEIFKNEDVLKQKVYLTRREWPYPEHK